MFATGKVSNVIVVFDALNGTRMHVHSQACHPFRRPNGISLFDIRGTSVLVVVERDAHRLQVSFAIVCLFARVRALHSRLNDYHSAQLIQLPDFTCITTVGSDILLRPYGISYEKTSYGARLFITDQGVPADGSPGRRIVVFDVRQSFAESA